MREYLEESQLTLKITNDFRLIVCSLGNSNKTFKKNYKVREARITLSCLTTGVYRTNLLLNRLSFARTFVAPTD